MALLLFAAAVDADADPVAYAVAAAVSDAVAYFAAAVDAPTGSGSRAKLVAYRWVSFLGEDDRRYSDWDNAAECSACGKRIVHVYTVATADGLAKVVGRECAHLAMGWTKPHPAALRAVEASSQSEDTKREHAGAYWCAVALADSSPSADASEAAYLARNAGRGADLMETWVLDGDTFYTVAGGLQGASLADWGWVLAG